MGVTDAHDWVKAGLNGTYKPRTITVILLDEQRNQVASFVLRNAQPKKWVGPTLAAKGGGEVAMEELHVVHEGIEYK
jgi:phage tail-like protein